jgi:hypothetical protein
LAAAGGSSDSEQLVAAVAMWAAARSHRNS